MTMNKLSKLINIKGVTLIEVLVAIVITSIGILGFASLQYLGLNSNQSAYARSQASFIASDLSERMRANIDGMNENQYAGATSAAQNCAAVPANYCDERNNAGTVQAAAACTAAQRAAHDIFIATCGYSSNEYADDAEKTSLLTDLLPNGRINIACIDSVTTDVDACTDFSDHVITVTWSESSEGTDANGQLQMTAPADKSVVYRVRI